MDLNGRDRRIVDNSIRNVIIQVKTSNPRCIPRKLLPSRSPKGYSEGTNHKGVRFTKGISEVSLSKIDKDLEKLGYHLIYGYYAPINEPDKAVSHQMKFIFSPDDEAQLSEPTMVNVQNAYRQVVGSAVWQIMGFLNPYVVHDIEIKDVYSMLFNLSHRKPYFNKNGDRLPTHPTYYLRINGSSKIALRRNDK